MIIHVLFCTERPADAPPLSKWRLGIKVEIDGRMYRLPLIDAAEPVDDATRQRLFKEPIEVIDK